MNKNIEKYVGIPYKPKGNSFKEGMDCVTLLYTYYAELGYKYELPEYTYDGKFRPSNLKQYVEKMRELRNKNTIITDIKDLLEDDLVCFSLSSTYVDLAGAYVGERKFLYMPHVGRSCLATFTPFWKLKFRYGVRLCP